MTSLLELLDKYGLSLEDKQVVRDFEAKYEELRAHLQKIALQQKTTYETVNQLLQTDTLPSKRSTIKRRGGTGFA